MVQVADAVGVRTVIRLAVLAGENGDQPPVPGIEIEVIGFRVVQVRLFEHERHAQNAFPEVDRRLPVGAVQRDVVNALYLDYGHRLVLPVL